MVLVPFYLGQVLLFASTKALLPSLSAWAAIATLILPTNYAALAPLLLLLGCGVGWKFLASHRAPELGCSRVAWPCRRRFQNATALTSPSRALLQGCLAVVCDHGATLRSSWSIDDSREVGRLVFGASLDYDAVRLTAVVRLTVGVRVRARARLG